MAKKRRNRGFKQAPKKAARLKRPLKTGESVKYHKNGSATFTRPDGSAITLKTNGEKKWAKVRDLKEGETAKYKADGSAEIKRTDGSALVYNLDGSTTTWLPLEVDDADNFLTTASGTVEMCGTSMPFFVQTDILTEEDREELPFGKCCGDDPAAWGALFCMGDSTVTAETPSGDTETWNAFHGQITLEDDSVVPSVASWGFSGPNPDPPDPGVAGVVEYTAFCTGGGWTLYFKNIDEQGNVGGYSTVGLAGIQESCNPWLVDFGNVLFRG